jgi:hypothetical protein
VWSALFCWIGVLWVSSVILGVGAKIVGGIAGNGIVIFWGVVWFGCSKVTVTLLRLGSDGFGRVQMGVRHGVLGGVEG